MIIDSHVHCYPDSVIANPSRWGEDRGEHHWVDLVTNGPQGWANPEDLLRQMDADGVERVVLQAWYWQNPQTVLEQNYWHAEWVSRYPGRFLAMAAIHPELSDPPKVLQEARSWGACGVGECLPQIQTTAGWEHTGWAEILGWTSRYDWPICLHVTEPVGHLYKGRVETCLQTTLRQIENWPTQRWILAHWGGGFPFFALNHRVQKVLPRVWFDTAASPLLYNSNVWQAVLQLVGAERVLFGSDFPLKLYPRYQSKPNWALLLEEVREQVPSLEAQGLIFEKNAAEVFKPEGSVNSRPPSAT